MTAFHFVLNGENRAVDDIDPNAPLLWILRHRLDMVGTKFDCGRGGYRNRHILNRCFPFLGGYRNFLEAVFPFS